MDLHDDKGPIAPRTPQTGDNPRDRVEDGVIVLERPPVGAVHLVYELRSGRTERGPSVAREVAIFR